MWGLGRAARAEALLSLGCLGASLPEAISRGPPLAEPEAMSQGGVQLVPRLASAPHIMERSGSFERRSHLVTGGTRGLGLLTARWLAQHGARALVLSSASGAVTRDASGERAQLEASELSMLAQRHDAAEVAHTQRLAALLLGPLPPVVGVWHAAGVLADGVLPKLDMGALARVHAPKASGASSLHAACAAAGVRALAFFSSVSALLLSLIHI